VYAENQEGGGEVSFNPCFDGNQNIKKVDQENL